MGRRLRYYSLKSRTTEIDKSCCLVLLKLYTCVKAKRIFDNNQLMYYSFQHLIMAQ